VPRQPADAGGPVRVQMVPFPPASCRTTAASQAAAAV
jgi:hypothetical protein